jgi:hypothetical protein
VIPRNGNRLLENDRFKEIESRSTACERCGLQSIDTDSTPGSCWRRPGACVARSRRQLGRALSGAWPGPKVVDRESASAPARTAIDSTSLLGLGHEW